MASEKAWSLYYWGQDVVGCGRAEFVRLIFEEAQIPYTNKDDTKKIAELFVRGQWSGYPAFATPVIERDGFSLAQTGVICRYLGKKYNLYPDNEADEWHADQINVTIHDYVAEGRNSFHGVKWGESYHKQKEETQPFIDRFASERLPKFLTHFEKILAANNGGKGFVVGSKLTYIDLELLHTLRVTESQFPDAWKSQDKIPLLKAFKTRMETRPNLAAYFKSGRCRPFEGNSMM